MINNLEYVTLASDASVGKASGFAYYLRSDNGTIKRAWFSNENLNTFEAEFRSLYAGLQEAKNHLGENTKLIVYCDNEVCLRVIDDRFSHNKARNKYLPYIEKAKLLTSKFSEVETRHVKAHTLRSNQKKYYMNRWCDINARRQMRYLGRKPIREKLYGLAGKAEAKST